MDSLNCPLTAELFRDPVTAQDGHTYERHAITKWLRQNATSPITREPMTVDSLRPNYIVKRMIDDFTITSRQKQYAFQLDTDIRKTKKRPLFQTPGKTIYEATWTSKPGPPIILLRIDGAKARREASFYVQLGCHPHIVRTYGTLENDSNSLTLVQEYATEGDLLELLREKEFQPTDAVLLEIFIQITDAMICLADNGIVHGDLACRNVLVFRFNNSDPQANLVKLTDFGLTRASTLYSVADSTASSTLIIVPLRYAAPEILQSTDISSYSEKSDVYSMGVLMWEACSSGQMPYASIANDNEIRRSKINGEILTQPNNCNEALWNIIVRCWHQQPNARPTFKALKRSLLELQFTQGSNSVNAQNDKIYPPKRSTFYGDGHTNKSTAESLPFLNIATQPKHNDDNRFPAPKRNARHHAGQNTQSVSTVLLPSHPQFYKNEDSSHSTNLISRSSNSDDEDLPRSTNIILRSSNTHTSNLPCSTNIVLHSSNIADENLSPSTNAVSRPSNIEARNLPHNIDMVLQSSNIDDEDLPRSTNIVLRSSNIDASNRPRSTNIVSRP